MSNTDARKIKCKTNVDVTNFHDTIAMALAYQANHESIHLKYFVLTAQFYYL